MSKSLVHSLEGYVTASFKDLRPTYNSASDWERDYKRSLHELAIRGERFLTIDLPAIRKHLERCLEDHMYTSNGGYLSAAVSRRVVVPAYMRDLYLQIFEKDGKLRADPSIEAIADLRQWYECFGKLKHPCDRKVINDEVYNFYVIEKELRSPSLNWLGDDLCLESRGVSNRLSFVDLCQQRILRSETLFDRDNEPEMELLSKSDADTLQRVCDILSSQLGDFHDERLSELPKHGKGRVSDIGKTESKFGFLSWPAKLNLIFPHDRYGTPDLGVSLYLDETGRVPLNREHPSKLIAVPKTMSGPRLIASEPSYHQWIQQLVRNQIEDRVRRTSMRHSISFGDQMPNRTLATLGSQTRQLTTVDLKSASDRLSCWTVERALRANRTLLERIHASRTRMMVNRVTKSHFDKLILKKCFTQGSACTFPVQTLIYSMLAITAVILADNQRVTTKNIEKAARKVRVFGDDIIIPTNALLKLTEILSAVQLKVNLSKTFHNGWFRESCGRDAYAGINVTPARIKRFSINPSHEEVDSMLASSNNLHRRGMWHTADWLLSHIRRFSFLVVPIRDSDGISSFCGESRDHLRKRWNPSLQRVEWRVHGLDTSAKIVPTQSAHDLMQFLCVKDRSAKSNLAYLFPTVPKDLGIVNKTSSVMKTGWTPMFHREASIVELDDVA